MCANSGRSNKETKIPGFFFQNCCLTLLFEKVLKNHEQKMSPDRKISFTKVVGHFIYWVANEGSGAKKRLFGREQKAQG